MKPWEQLGRASMPDGSEMRLARRDTELVIFVDGKILMSSRMHGSEEHLAALGCRQIGAVDAPHVLVGGLGMGFTLRATLDLLPPEGIVTVAELVPAVVEWNRGSLAPLAGHPLDDPRVRIEAGDVGAVLRARRDAFDAILLDVDNGPSAFTTGANDNLYDNAGVAAMFAATRPGGTVAVWSAWEDRKFEQRLRYHGFSVEMQRVRARLKKGGPRHTIFLGVKPARRTAGP
jgi:spermidine synthase